MSKSNNHISDIHNTVIYYCYIYEAELLLLLLLFSMYFTCVSHIHTCAYCHLKTSLSSNVFSSHVSLQIAKCKEKYTNKLKIFGE